jgi:septal ring-binding cell division protein DamX
VGSRAAKAAPSPVPARPPAAAVSAAPSEGGPDSREGWARRAESDRKRLASDKRTRYAIQLELVCEVESLREAWKHDRGKAMWLLPVAHGGRDCFRVFWGRYPSLDAAKKGKTGIPPYFTTARNHPAVVAVR